MNEGKVSMIFASFVAHIAHTTALLRVRPSTAGLAGLKGLVADLVVLDQRAFKASWAKAMMWIFLLSRYLCLQLLRIGPT